MLKKILSFLVASFVFIGMGISAVAETFSFDQFKIKAEFNSDFTVITKDNFRNYPEIIKAIGHTEKSINTYFENNDILLLAIKDSNRKQIQVSARQTGFSKKIVSASNLKNENLAVIGETVFDGDFDTENINGTVFLYRTVEDNDSVQFIAIENSYFYSISLHGYKEEELLEALEAIKIEHTSKPKTSTVYIIFFIIVISLAIIGLIAAMVIVIIRIVKDIRKKDTEQEIIEDIKIKRRKF